MEQLLHSGHRKRIKERYLEKGVSALDDKDIVELLLTYAIPRRDVYPLARELTHEFGSVEGVLSADPEALLRHPGVTEHTTVFLRLINDIRVGRDRFIEYRREQLSSVKRAVEYCHRAIGRFSEEVVIELLLDESNYVTEILKVSFGSNDAAVLPVEEIVENALRLNVSNIVIAHNHPSGSSAPSSDDLAATDILLDALSSASIKLSEHIIVAKDECTALIHHQTMPIDPNTGTVPTVSN